MCETEPECSFWKKLAEPDLEIDQILKIEF
jgi:hypothetical protein